ncbi:MAG TPA: ATP-dependent helicase [Phycisphaerales bacterium]|nr:ATP-dependent helicase [Phycisphaerales bacterium]
MTEPWSSGLNAAQQRAVEHDAGPVAVLAGPGTGKTRVLTHRVARLIQRDGAPPESICAVTFTVKSANEMKDRLESLIGAGPASGVAASNFHSMGRRMLARFGDVIGLPVQHTLMDSVQRNRLLREAIGRTLDADELDPALLADGGRDGLASRIWTWITHLQQNAVFPDDAADLVEQWRHLLDLGGPESSPWDETRCEAEAHKLRDFSAAAKVYAHFDALRLDRGMMLYPDYILLPIRLMRASERARSIIHDEFRHVLVDEFQDVNVAQLELLRELAPPAPGRDLCVVGDDDQAIYGFRGSDDRAFQHFNGIWTDAETIILDESYRSSPAIVETAQHIINRANDRYQPDKSLHARRVFDSPPPEKVEAVHVMHNTETGPLIAAMILADRKTNPDRALSSMAVIASTRKTLAEVGQALRLEGIPVDDSVLNPDQEDEAVQDVRSWIELLTTSSGASMVRLLTRPPISMDTADAIAFQHAFERDGRIARAEGEKPPRIADWIAEHSDEHAGLARFASMYSELHDQCTIRPASQMVRSIIERVGVAHRELPDASTEAERIQALVRFVRYAERLQPRLDPPGDLAAFARYDAELDEDERSGKQPDLDTNTDDDDPQSEGVRLLTAHGSKGLEFDTVFIPKIGLTKGCFGNLGDSKDPMLPEGLSKMDAGPSHPKQSRQDEVRRLFYVACTRAERRLVLFSKAAKKRSPGNHLFQELTWTGEAPDSVLLQNGQDLLARCIELGADLRRYDPQLAESTPIHARSAVLASARRTARKAAAAALDRAEDGIDSPDHAEQIEQTLMLAARTLAITRALEFGPIESLPGWLLTEELSETAQQLSRALNEAREDRTTAQNTGKALRPPLKLSYSQISTYTRCPACYYLRYVLRLPEGDSAQQLVGTVTHRALELFYKRWIMADAEGSPKPGRDDLLRIGREVFFEQSRLAGGADPALLEQITAQLGTGYDALHSDTDEIMMLEEQAPFDYRRAAGDPEPHCITAKIDRVDRLPGGGLRIIDYKTGQAWKKLLEPKKDDLQLGIYALALVNHLGYESVDELQGQAEYWLFATGQRGVIPFGDINFNKVRAEIDKAIEGMLAGEFDPKKGCTGPCGTFFPDSDSLA